MGRWVMVIQEGDKGGRYREERGGVGVWEGGLGSYKRVTRDDFAGGGGGEGGEGEWVDYQGWND